MTGRAEIERVTAVDAALVVALNSLFDEGMVWDAEQGQQFLANPDVILLIARWNGHVCGFLTAHRLPRFDRRRAEVLLYEIGVEEAYQRRGVGRALVEGAKQWASTVGADELWVLTEAANGPARALYAATGGREDPPGITLVAYPVAAGAEKAYGEATRCGDKSPG